MFKTQNGKMKKWHLKDMIDHHGFTHNLRAVLKLKPGNFINPNNY